MDKQVRILIISIIISPLILSACDALKPYTKMTDVPGLSSTLAIQTMVANPGLIFLVKSPTPTLVRSTPHPVLSDSELISAIHPTNTPLPTNTLVPSLTPIEAISNGSNINSLSGECINAAEFIKDVTIPDDTIVKPGMEFTKIWQLKNVGSCTWTLDYFIILVTGDQLGANSPKQMDIIVEPGMKIDLSINMIAPKEPNYYQGNWMFQDDHGDKFGTGREANDPFWVAIKVYQLGWRDLFRGSDRTWGGGGCGGGG